MSFYRDYWRTIGREPRTDDMRAMCDDLRAANGPLPYERFRIALDAELRLRADHARCYLATRPGWRY